MLSVGRWDTETEPTGKPEDMSIEKKKKHIHTMMAGAIMEFMILGEVTGGENDLEIAEAQCELFGFDIEATISETSQLIKDHEKKILTTADMLMEHKTLNEIQIQLIISGK